MKLDVTLSKNDTLKIKETLHQAQQFEGITLHDIVSDIKNRTLNSKFFEVINDWFDFAFGTHNQTIETDNGFIIGHVFNTNTDFTRTDSIFQIVRPSMSFQEKLDLTLYPNQPKTPLNETEIQKLLCWSLLGLQKNNQGFVGYFSLLQNRLLPFNNTMFSFNQLLSLVSIVSLNDGVDDRLITSLKQLNSSMTDLALMDYFIDAANDQSSISRIIRQNQMLKLAALFHGQSESINLDIHLTRQVVDRLTLSDANLTRSGETPRWGLPIGDYQSSSFKGFINRTEVLAPTHIDYPYKKWTQLNVFGTSKNDVFNLTNSNCDPIEGIVATVAFGGDGDDLFIAGEGASQAFLAGNKGWDTYVYKGSCVDSDYELIVSDSDHRGKVYFGAPTVYSSNRFAGPVVDGILDLGNTFTLKEIHEKDGTTTLSFKGYYGSNQIKILDFQQGQFSIVTGLKSSQLDNNNYPVFSAVNPSGNVAFLSATKSNLGGKISITRLDGTLLHIVQTLNDEDAWNDVMIVALQNDAFVVAGSSKQGCQLTYTLVEPPFSKANITVVDSIYGCSEYKKFTQSWVNTIGPDQKQAGITYVKSEPLGTYVYLPNQGTFVIRWPEPNLQETSNYIGATNRGFIISIPAAYQQEYSSQLMEFDSRGKLLLNQTLPLTTITSTSPRADGYFVFYAKGEHFNSNQKTYAAIVKDGNWTEELENGCRGGYFTKPSYAFSQTLKNGNTLLMSYPDICIFNNKNEIEIGPFYLYGNANRQEGPLAIGRLANDDIALVYNSYEGELLQKAVVLPPTFELQETSRINKRAKTPIRINNEDEEVFISNAAKIQPSLPDFGATLALGFVFWNIGKSCISSLSKMYYSWRKTESNSTLKAEQEKLIKQYSALYEKAKPFFKKDYSNDYMRWEMENFATDIERATNVTELISYEKDLIKLSEKIQRNNVSKSAHINKSISFNNTRTLFENVGFFGENKSETQLQISHPQYQQLTK